MSDDAENKLRAAAIEYIETTDEDGVNWIYSYQDLANTFGVSKTSVRRFEYVMTRLIKKQIVIQMFINTLYRHVAALKKKLSDDDKAEELSDTQAVNRKGGRPRVITQFVKDKLTQEAQQRDLSKNSFTRESLMHRANELVLEEARKIGKNAYAVTQLSASSFKRLRKEVTPEIVPAARPQNQRRLEALMDALNHISLAAMWPVVAQLPSGAMINPRNAFNTDKMSLLAETSNDDLCQLYLAQGSKQKLRKLGLSPSTTITRPRASHKKRGIGLTVLTRADGVMCAVVVEFKDYAFKEVKYYQVRN
jgi:predicted transcriptional regulator